MEGNLFDLADWRRRVAELYASIRSAQDPSRAWALWAATRDDLIRDHPQSPLPEETRASFGGAFYYDYDPAARVLGVVTPADPQRYEIPTSDNGTMAFSRFADVSFELRGRDAKLELYWLDGYGGGIFLSFRDTTSGSTTYGAGRYLLDTIKGADLGMQDGKLVLDFNFAYNPSCSYDPRWICPLAPPPNRLDFAVEAGERTA